MRQYTPEGTFKAFEKNLDRLKDMGVQTLWFMPIQPISKTDRKGVLGSYYAIANYTAINPEFGNLDDWKALVKSAQGKGFATEGARTIVDFAFNQLALNEVVAITALPNRASRHVMEKLGMTHRPELDFDHPRVPADHQYQRHTLYNLRNPRSKEAPCPSRS